MVFLRCLFLLAFAATLPAQDLAAIQREAEAKLNAARQKILTEKYAALRAYVDQEVDPQPADLAEALLETARLAADLDTAQVQRGYAERALAASKDGRLASRARLELGDAQSRAGASSEELTKTYQPLLAEASLEDGSVDAAFTAAIRLSSMLAERGDKEPAKAIWSSLAEKVGHPQLAEIAKMQSAQLERLGTEPPALAGKDLAGNEVSLAGWKGKVVLIDFWATWCGPCLQELPNVEDAYSRFHDQGFEIVGVSLDHDRARLQQFLTQSDLPWPQIYDADHEQALAKAYGVESIPATFLISRDGKISRIGLRGEDLIAAVRMLVERKP